METFDTLEKRLTYRTKLEDRRAQGLITIDELLDLGALYVDEGPHEPFTSVYSEILSRDPSHVMARIWTAHFLTMIGYLREDWERAIAIAENLIPLGGDVAAACYSIQDAAYQAMGNCPIERHIDVLEKSVAEAADWHWNREQLAFYYAEVGREGDAICQLEAGLRNLFEDFDPFWRPQTRLWETAITGRVIHLSQRKEEEVMLQNWRVQVDGGDADR